MGDNFIWRPHRKPPAPAAVGTWIQRSLGALLVQQNQELQRQHQQKQQSAFSFLGRSAGAGRNPLVLASHVPDEGQPGWQDEDQDALVGGNTVKAVLKYYHRMVFKPVVTLSWAAGIRNSCARVGVTHMQT